MRRVTDWANAASLATAGGTLVLAVATFASIRSANKSARTAERAARIAERSLLAGQRPLLVNSRLGDADQKIQFVEGNWLRVPGGGAAVTALENAVYLAVSVRNVGTGLAVLHGWHVLLEVPNERAHPPLTDFTGQIRDIYIAPGDNGVWQGAFRDTGAEIFKAVRAAIEAGELIVLSLLYGDYEGGQRVITQFSVRYVPSEDSGQDGRWVASAARHFNVDGPDPR
jgi:hypothetical protein